MEVGEVREQLDRIEDEVRNSYNRISTILKARELMTYNQLDIIKEQCELDKNFRSNCAKNLSLCLDQEGVLINNIKSFSIIDIEKLNMEAGDLKIEDYLNNERKSNSNKQIERSPMHADKKVKRQKVDSDEPITTQDVSDVTTPTTPTQDWLNQIKHQIEVEPSSAVDSMEHSNLEQT